ncbi:MAG: ABC transporter ATP-binding protein [Bacillota bacterium]
MALLLAGVGKQFNDLQVLTDLNLAVEEGEFVCLVGPSGCGKTTLLRIIGGLDQPWVGTVQMDGKKIDPAKGDIGFVFQENSLFPWLTARGNIEFALRARGFGSREIEKRVDYYLELVGLSEFAGFYPGQLSGGMKQRVGIARAMAYGPKVLLMDEPFAALDAQTREIMQQELLRIWSKEKKTVVFVTHSIEEAVFLADRVIVLLGHPATIKDIVNVTVARPRQRTSEDFNRLRQKILFLLEGGS